MCEEKEEKEGDGKFQLRCEERSELNETETLFEEVLDGEKEISWTFEREGKYSFRCLLNPNICGVIVVARTEEESQRAESQNKENFVNSIANSRRSSKASSNTETKSGNISTCLSFQENYQKDRENNASEKTSRSYQIEKKQRLQTKSQKQQQHESEIDILSEDQGLSNNKLKLENRQRKLKEQQEAKLKEYNQRCQKALSQKVIEIYMHSYMQSNDQSNQVTKENEKLDLQQSSLKYHIEQALKVSSNFENEKLARCSEDELVMIKQLGENIQKAQYEISSHKVSMANKQKRSDMFERKIKVLIKSIQEWNEQRERIIKQSGQVCSDLSSLFEQPQEKKKKKQKKKKQPGIQQTAIFSWNEIWESSKNSIEYSIISNIELNQTKAQQLMSDRWNSKNCKIYNPQQVAQS